MNAWGLFCNSPVRRRREFGGAAANVPRVPNALAQANFASIPQDPAGGPLPSIDVADALLDERAVYPSLVQR